ncbi:Hpt domain-containing protein [Rhizobium rhizophilum]|uniref:Hpt domain-containing protein n=1 Tax=Rhizobium rhizophilum TaxID=1850373 RepID=A0ABY2QNQ3_9HYPH|nr:Hpt domain-containing protein [Rhizobium rhizophilum]MBX9469084.1 Hpt domain-containing protein [Rhizobium sp.]THV10955.1 Hpt domain-containing protein [Rhizobium rhizophilum]
MAAAVNIAFEAPDNLNGLTPSQQRPIDLVHLATQTKGDKAVEIEILQIFARQARGCLVAMTGGHSKVEVKAAANRLRNAAMAVGALRVAAAADLVETKGATSDSMASVSSAVLEAEHFILKLAR